MKAGNSRSIHARSTGAASVAVVGTASLFVWLNGRMIDGIVAKSKKLDKAEPAYWMGQKQEYKAPALKLRKD